jgi:hypothetical protein
MKDHIDSLRPSRNSLKERLKQQAADKLAEESRRETERAEAEAFYLTQLKQRMLHAADYFKEIVTDLQTLDADTVAYFPFGSTGERLVPLRQHDYQIFVDDRHSPQEIQVVCTCELKLPVSRTVLSLSEANLFNTFLRNTGIPFHRFRQEDLSRGGDESSRFTIEGSLTAGFLIKAEPAAKSVKVQLRNIEDEPVREYLLQPDRIDEELLDRLGRLLLRETDTFITTTVPDEVRRELQAESERRERERRQIAAEAQRIAELEEQARLKNRAQTSMVKAGEEAERKIRKLSRWAVDRIRRTTESQD